MLKLAGFYLDYLRLKQQARASELDLSFGKFYPCLDERETDSGSASGHYFHQDLLVATRIFHNNPQRHVDIGSRIDGVVAHVAVFREIEVFDVRPMTTSIPNIIFRQADFMHNDLNLKNYCDSASSLHAIEHFGLGRYGENLDYNGHLKGLHNIYEMLQEGGKFYFSVPIGKPRIEFNAHRVFAVKYLIEMLQEKYRIDSFSYVNDDGKLFRDIPLIPEDFENSYGCKYGCGIFELTKTTKGATDNAVKFRSDFSEPIKTSSSRSVTLMLKQKIKNIIQDYRHRKAYRKWQQSDKLISTLHTMKQMTVKAYADKYGADVFVETGTYLGEMLDAVKYSFKKLYSIELSPDLYERTAKKFARHKHITVLEGDSPMVLPEILNQIYEPCLFWLDAHYSEGITVRGDKETPILGELERIFSHPIEGHIILIDDARFFTGQNDYPALEELKELVLRRYPTFVFDVKDDIIRIHSAL